MALRKRLRLFLEILKVNIKGETFMRKNKKTYEELVLQMHLLNEDIITTSSNFDDGNSSGNVDQDDFYE